MDPIFIFIISITVAAILFSSFSGMVKLSQRAHEEEEREERERELRRRRKETQCRRLLRDNQPTPVGTIKLDENARRWYDAQQSTHTEPISSIEEYEETEEDYLDLDDSDN